jgi:putative ABC transport system permease protein
MADRFPWRTAFKIAWRESRSSPAKFLFVILAVAVGVGALTGVRSFSRAFRGMLVREARTLMAADLTVRVFSPATPPQVAAMEELEKRGVRRTQVTETVSMVSSSGVPDPLLVAVKAVDPSVFPFYGTVRLDPPGALSGKLTDDAVAVSADLLMRLRVGAGGLVKVGGQDFRVAGTVVEEPDRMTGTINVGPRLLISRKGLDRAGLISVGSRASERYLFRLPAAGIGVAEVRDALRKVFPQGRIVDFRESHPLITHGLDDATTFLSLVSLIAMIVGALGVATAMQSHLEQKMDSIAVMKSIGGRSSQILRIYLLQTAMLGAAGSLLGIMVGWGVERVFPYLIARYFTIQTEIRLDPVPAIQGLLTGMAVTLLFTLPTLLRIRRIRPTVIFRRDAPEARPAWRERLRTSGVPLAAAAIILAGIGSIVAWLSESLRIAGYFAGGVAVCVIALSGVAWALLKGLKALLRAYGRRLPVPVRYGMANLYRPGNHAGVVLVALGTGVMFTLSIYLLQRSVLQKIVQNAPPGMPNVFLVNITEREKSGLLELLNQQRGLLQAPFVVGSAEARLTAINGVALAQSAARGPERRGRRSFSVTWADRVPDNTQVVKGEWWKSPPPSGQFAVSVAEEEAARLGIEPGSTVQFDASGRTVEARVAAIYRTESLRPGSSIEFVFSPGALAGVPLTYYGGLRAEPQAVPRIQRAAYERYPTVTVINIADVLEIVQGVLDQVALVTRFISAFAILAGVVILAASVAGSRFRRIREVAILKTVGATRRTVASIFSVEFLILGGVAGLMGSLLATGFSALALKRLFSSAQFQIDFLPNLLAIVLTALVAVLAGWLASFRILGKKPLEVLRGE